MFKEIVLKNRKTSLVLESTISKVSKVNLNHFSTNWIRKCGISFKRIALILERKTNFFDSVFQGCTSVSTYQGNKAFFQIVFTVDLASN